ncbi:hypothetical protein GCM10011514_30210 [Emticicia aquatilis]|uniref:Uncharacterized protein n=1 Tax=Emticicia aquatilis TaxID=1537369 RepID=A0A916YW83_9BACT|nr:hypothetical protein [Emticicia aquatilis]GGD64217.1 hypothetical protein GCM10011514_30210 [Emticicia aquatilis]
MKNQLIVLFIMSLLLLVGCDHKDVLEVESTDLTSKDIQIKDASGLNFVKLRVSSENEELLKNYSENSFEITFVKTELDTGNAVSGDNQVLPSETIASVDIEIIETNIPEYARVSYKNRSNTRALAPRWVTVNLFAFAPKNYLWVYNKSSNTASVTFAYNRSASGGSWVGAGTKSMGIRKEASYCNMTAKQIRATHTYDANAGSYNFITWQYFKCP